VHPGVEARRVENLFALFFLVGEIDHVDNFDGHILSSSSISVFWRCSGLRVTFFDLPFCFIRSNGSRIRAFLTIGTIGTALAAR
jgi:hypothetical protein